MRSSRDPTDHLGALQDVVTVLSRKQALEGLEADYLSSVAPLIPAHATALYLFRPQSVTPVRIAARGVDPDFLSRYEKLGREVDPLRCWITRTGSPNQSQRLLGLEGWQHHPVYDVVGLASIDFAMQAPVVYDGSIIGTMNFGRDTTEGPFSAADLKAVSILSTFLGLAIARSLGCGEHGFEDLCRAIDGAPCGLVIMDEDHAPCFLNQVAREICSRNFDAEAHPEGLSPLLRDSAAHRGEWTTRNEQVSAKSCLLPAGRRHSLVFLEETAPPPVPPSIAQALSSREVEVLLLVDKGLRNKPIAQQLGISINTVKRHLDNIYCKLNVHSRTEMVAKFHRIARLES